MRIAHFFIERPIFACAVSVIITLLGAITFPTLAVDQYPRIAPPTVTVSATYPGASAEVMAGDVAAPIEQQINGVDDMLYMSSQSIGEGESWCLEVDADFTRHLVHVRRDGRLFQRMTKRFTVDAPEGTLVEDR